MGERYKENFDDYDATPYRGGYDQTSEYGSVKPASVESSYAAADYDRDEDDRSANSYGAEVRPYGGGRSSNESEYGAKPSYHSSHESAGTGRGRPGSFGQGSADSYEQEGRRGREGYAKPEPAYGESAYGGGFQEEQTRPNYGGGYEEEQTGNDRPLRTSRPSYGEGYEEQDSGYEGALGGRGRGHHAPHEESYEGRREQGYGGRRGFGDEEGVPRFGVPPEESYEGRREQGYGGRREVRDEEEVPGFGQPTYRQEPRFGDEERPRQQHRHRSEWE